MGRGLRKGCARNAGCGALDADLAISVLDLDFGEAVLRQKLGELADEVGIDTHTIFRTACFGWSRHHTPLSFAAVPLQSFAAASSLATTGGIRIARLYMGRGRLAQSGLDKWLKCLPKS